MHLLLLEWAQPEKQIQLNQNLPKLHDYCHKLKSLEEFIANYFKDAINLLVVALPAILEHIYTKFFVLNSRNMTTAAVLGTVYYFVINKYLILCSYSCMLSVAFLWFVEYLILTLVAGLLINDGSLRLFVCLGRFRWWLSIIVSSEQAVSNYLANICNT